MTCDEIETRIVEKAEHVEAAVTVLSRKQSLDRDEYVDDREQRAIVEREFQTSIEACIDVAQLLLTVEDITVPETYAEVFVRLADADVLTAETADVMGGSRTLPERPRPHVRPQHRRRTCLSTPTGRPPLVPDVPQ